MENLQKLTNIIIFLLIFLLIFFAINFVSSKISYAEKIATKKVIISTNLCIDWLILDSLYNHKNNENLLVNNIFILSPLINKAENQGDILRWKNLISKLPKHSGTLESIIQKIQFQPHVILSGEFDNPLLKNRLQRLNFNILTLKFPQQVSQILPYQAEFEKIIGIKNNFQDLKKYTKYTKYIKYTKYKNANKKTLLLLGANEIAFANNTFENDILNYSKIWKNYLPNNIYGYIAVNKEMLIKNPPAKIIFLQNFNNQKNSLATNFFHENFYKNFGSNKNSYENSKWQWQCPGKWSFDLIEMLNYE